MAATMLRPSTNATLGGMPLWSDLPMFQNEKFFSNLTQVLNISAENLTNLLQTVQASAQTEQQTLLASQTPMTLLATLSVCYALIFIAGVLGNLITCIVISRNNFMHTATNFYLFNLAISDLILLCSGMPQDLYNLWQPDNYPFTDSICILESVLSETAANATVLTITAFTVERYIAICHPFRQHTMSKLSRAIKFIFAIWITALLLALPQAIQFSVALVPGGGGSSCTMKNDFFAHVFAVSGFLFFGGPMTAICVLYVLIGMKLKRSRLLQSLPRRSYDIHRGISAQTRVIRMLVAVAVAFFICWAPFHAQRLMAAYGSSSGIESPIFNDIFNVLNYTSGVLYFLSTCINPLLYNIMSHKFREAFKVTLARHFRLSAKYQSQSQPHNYSALRRHQHDSLQRKHITDSLRTTTTSTTTTMMTLNGGSNAGGRNSQRLQRDRFSFDGSHATLLSCNAQSRQDLFAGRTSLGMGMGLAAEASASHQPAQQRLLQRQISQLSSMGDAHSLLEAEIDDCVTQLQPYRNRRSFAAPTALEPAAAASAATGISHSKPEEEYELAARHNAGQGQAGGQAMCTIVEQPGVSRSRLKLTRITRPPQETPQSSASVGESNGKVHKTKAKTQKTSNALKSLKAKFNWRARRKSRRASSTQCQKQTQTPAQTPAQTQALMQTSSDDTQPQEVCRRHERGAY